MKLKILFAVLGALFTLSAFVTLVLTPNIFIFGIHLILGIVFIILAAIRKTNKKQPYCTNCGIHNDSSYKFCINCGTVLNR